MNTFLWVTLGFAFGMAICVAVVTYWATNAEIVANEETFKCIGCGQSLPISSYYKKNNKRGHDCRCKDCRTGLQNSKRQLMATEGKWQF